MLHNEQDHRLLKPGLEGLWGFGVPEFGVKDSIGYGVRVWTGPASSSGMPCLSDYDDRGADVIAADADGNV